MADIQTDRQKRARRQTGNRERERKKGCMSYKAVGRPIMSIFVGDREVMADIQTDRQKRARRQIGGKKREREKEKVYVIQPVGRPIMSIFYR